MPAAPLTTVTDDPARSRYEARTDEGLVAVAEYERTGQLVVFTHTAVEPGFGGRGLATDLVRQALDDVRARALRVVPVCPFVAAFLERHAEEYGDLVLRSRTVVEATD